MTTIIKATVFMSFFVLNILAGIIPAWNASYYGILENREFANLPKKSETMFLGYLSANGSLSDKSNINGINAGVSLLHEFGSTIDKDVLFPSIYYKYCGELFSFHFGLLPRSLLMAPPRLVLDDSIRYYRPNIEGVAITFSHKTIEQQFVIDWLSRQTTVKYEQFSLRQNGCIIMPLQALQLYIKHDFHYWHFAGRNIMPQDPLRDEYGFHAIVGAAKRGGGFIDSMCIGIGTDVSGVRTRGLEPWNIPSGFACEATAIVGKFGVLVEAYKGSAHTLTFGDRLYAQDWYVRSDILFTPIQNSFCDARFAWSLHNSPAGLNHSQSFELSCLFGSHKNKRETQ